MQGKCPSFCTISIVPCFTTNLFHTLLLVFCLFTGSPLTVLRDYSWCLFSGSLLKRFEGPYVVPKINPEMDACKASILAPALSLSLAQNVLCIMIWYFEVLQKNFLSSMNSVSSSPHTLRHMLDTIPTTKVPMSLHHKPLELLYILLTNPDILTLFLGSESRDLLCSFAVFIFQVNKTIHICLFLSFFSHLTCWPLLSPYYWIRCKFIFIAVQYCIKCIYYNLFMKDLSMSVIFLTIRSNFAMNIGVKVSL